MTNIPRRVVPIGALVASFFGAIAIVLSACASAMGASDRGHSLATSHQYPRTVTDAFGNRTNIARAERIVAGPPVSDAIFGLGEGHRVVGRTNDADWPTGVIEAVPAIGMYSALNVEGLLSLGPDLVIVADWQSSFERNLGVLDQLQAAGVAVLVVPELKTAQQEGRYTMRVLEDGVRLIADALAVPAKGDELIARMREEAQAARMLAEGSGATVRALNVLPYNPGSTRVTGAMKPDDLAIRLAGAINVGAEAGIQGEKEVNPEDLIRMAPDVIIASEKIWQGQADPVAYHLLTPGLAETPAGKARRFVTWPDTPTHRASWRLPAAARELAEKLYAGRT